MKVDINDIDLSEFDVLLTHSRGLPSFGFRLERQETVSLRKDVLSIVSDMYSIHLSCKIPGRVDSLLTDSL